MSEIAYLDALSHILDHGESKTDRTGVGTQNVFHMGLTFDMDEGFPLLTTKRVWFRGIAEELFWFLSGSTNIAPLHEKKVHFWDEWADEQGDLGPIYGHQYTNCGATLKEGGVYNNNGTNQIEYLVRSIQENPNSRRHVISLWNANDIPQQRLPCCHGTVIQVFVSQGTQLDMSMYQRSGDMFLGVPFNIASYALLLHMLAQVTGHKPGKLHVTIGDAHIYHNHRDQVELQLSRTPRSLPTLTLNPVVKDLREFKWEDLEISGYKPHPGIKAPIAV